MKNLERTPAALGTAWIAALAVFLVHVLGNAHYGFFRDELYFIICGFHPQWGYVDQPPLVPLLAGATQAFGHSLFMLRLVPAVFAAAGVFVTCLLVIEFGGGAFAQAVAAITFLLTGVLMSFGMKVSPDTVGLLTWPLLALLVVRIVKGADRRLWLAAGVTAGVSIESKYSVLFFLAALVVGLLLTPQRKILLDKWFAAGAAVAIAIALPNFIWQWRYDFPMLELLRAGQSGKNLIVSPPLYLFQEILITGLFIWPVWGIGLVWLLATRLYRFLGYAYLFLIAEMLLFHGKHYYPADVYPILIAAGAVPIETWTRGRRILRGLVVAYVLIFGAVFVPFDLPVLSEQAMIRYQDRLSKIFHISRSATATEHNRETGLLPSDWADMHGWPELASLVARTYGSLPASERATAVVFAGNYGEASAVEFFDPGIPVISEHNQYWLWGPRGHSGNVMLQVNGSCFHSDHLFASRTLAGRLTDPWMVPEEHAVPIWICRGIKKPLPAMWDSIKVYE